MKPFDTKMVKWLKWSRNMPSIPHQMLPRGKRDVPFHRMVPLLPLLLAKSVYIGKHLKNAEPTIITKRSFFRGIKHRKNWEQFFRTHFFALPAENAISSTACKNSLHFAAKGSSHITLQFQNSGNCKKLLIPL